MQTSRHLAVAGVLLLVAVVVVPSAMSSTNETSAVTAGGHPSISETFSSVMVIGQGTPAGFSAGGQYRNYSGYMNTYILHPKQDYDTDGMADELDPDDDNDGLPDALELAGNAFMPAAPTNIVNADTDGDGLTDGMEAKLGTNPLDPNNLLAITSADTDRGTLKLRWKSRDNFWYEILRGDSLEALQTRPVVVDTIRAGSGTGAWQETESVFSLPTDGPVGFYRIRGIGPQ